MKIFGKILTTLPRERIIKILTGKKIYYLYMSRKVFKDFGPYFFNKPYVFVNISEERKRYGDYYCYEIVSFNKIVQSGKREKKVFYNIDTIRNGVRRL